MSGHSSTSTLLCLAASDYIQLLPDRIAGQNFLDLIVQWQSIFLLYSNTYISNRTMIASRVTVFPDFAFFSCSAQKVFVGQYTH